MTAARRSLGARLLPWFGCLLMLALAAGAARAQQEDPASRVGRLSELQGRVWRYDAEQGQWVEALRNGVLAGGDRLSTERGARADVRVGSTELRLDGETELEFARIDDERMVFQLTSGSLAVRVRSREIAREVEVGTAEARIVPERAGHYRIDREDDVTYAAAWRGSLLVETRDQRLQVPAGRRAEIFRQGPGDATVVSWSAPVNDEFSDWVARDERRDDRSVSQRYVSPEMTGVEDLDRYGRWDRHPEFGMVWFPLQVAVDWAPYRHGRWTWHLRWGWTWVDDAPWGFAPFHYGRWVHWGGRWCWSPGAYVARPVFAPALVAWVGGPQAAFSISIGGHSAPAVGWMPLAPRDVYVPPFAHGRRYYERVNQPHHPYYPRQVPTGPISYGNKGVPNAVTVVPSNVLAQRQPVAPQALRDHEVQRALEREQFRHETPLAPAPRPAPRVVAVPGGAEPARLPPPPGRDANAPPRVRDLRHERPAPSTGPMAAPPATPPARPVGPPAPRAAPTRPDGPPVPAAGGATRPVGPPAPAAGPARPEGPPAPAMGGRPVHAPGAGTPPAPQTPGRDDRGPRREDKGGDKGHDKPEVRDIPQRTPESRQNQRERQNLQ